MARDFYPFVEKDGEKDAAQEGATACEVHHPARIAVYDDASAAPRVVVIEPCDVRDYLEQITAAVNRLSHEQGGTIPFMVIREIVENFIHAYFQAPTITILDGGDTIRFSDQGPGIKEKSLAMEYGTSSATEEMKHYIRGVGSGLPYVQQYMTDKGGSLEIEDNIAGGTVVTISTRPREEARAVSGAGEEHEEDAVPEVAWQQPWVQQPWPGTYPQQAPYQQGYPQQPWAQPTAAPGAWPQAAPAAQPWQQPWPQGAPAPQQTWAQPQPWPAPAEPQATPAPAVPAVTLDERGHQALAFLAEHGAGGPTELVRAFGSSAATWSRALSSLTAQGLVVKVGQKYQLTAIGRTFA